MAEGRLSRWSRLKQEKRQETILDSREAPEAAEELAPVPPQAEDGAPVPAENAEGAAAEQQANTVDVEELPDPETMTAESDFTGFLADNVPEELRRRALKVLWKSDPVLANLDGLNDYDEDFRTIEVIGEAVQTAYKAGKGYVFDDEEEDAEDAEGEEVVAEAETENPQTSAEDDAAASEEADAPEADVGDEHSA